MESRDQKVIDDAFTGGLLHDLGKPILLINFPEYYKQIEELKKQRQISFWTEEKEIIGTEHSFISAYLLRLGGLPDPVVEGVAFHHSFSMGQTGFTPLFAVQAANIIAYELNGEQENPKHLPNMDYWEKLGLSDKFRIWMEIWKKMDKCEKGGLGEDKGKQAFCCNRI